MPSTAFGGRALSSGYGHFQRVGNALSIYQLVMDGDSRIYGTGTSNPATQSFPAQLQVLLGSAWTVLNYGVPGQQEEGMLQRQAATILPLFIPGAKNVYL